MRIVIDLQGAQTESRFRGIGRYALALTKAIVRNKGPHEVIIALSGLFPETIEPIRSEFNGILSQNSIRVWHAVGPTRDCDPLNSQRRLVAELLREAAILALRPEVVLVTSMFEGFGDDAVTSVGQFDVSTPTVSVLYDLIPLIAPDEHFRSNPIQSAYYFRKINSLKRCSALLAISESARLEALTALDFSADAVTNISCGFDARFLPYDFADGELESLQARVGLSKPFLMYTGGADERKNLFRLIEAFSELPVDIRTKYQLLMVGKMPTHQVAALKRHAKKLKLCEDDVVFTGYVSNKDLLQLYTACHLFVFPSLHEGFGLPPLEAMGCGAPVVASHATSLPEVIGREDALFDPLSSKAISEKILEVLTMSEFRHELIRYGHERVRHFSWDECARKAIDVMGTVAKPPMITCFDDTVRVINTQLFGDRNLKILVLKLDHMGDFVLATPALIRLRARYPDALIDVVVGSWNVEAASQLKIFNEIFTLDFFSKKSSVSSKTSAQVEELLSELGFYDFAIDLRRNRDTRFILAKVPAVTRVGFATGIPNVDKELSICLPSILDKPHLTTALNQEPAALQMLRLIDALPVNPSDYISQTHFMPEVSRKPGYVAIFPNAGNTVKEWGTSNFIDLIQILEQDPCIYQIGVFIGTNVEAKAYDSIGCLKLSLHVGFNYQNLRETLATYSLCIANNSYGAHLASSLGLKVVGIYGGHETAMEWGPVFGPCQVLYVPIACSPCHIPAVSDCKRNLECLTLITPERVYDALRDMNHDVQQFGFADLTSTLIDRVSTQLDSFTEYDLAAIATAIAQNHSSRTQPCLFVDISELVVCDAGTGIQRAVKGILQALLDSNSLPYEVLPVYATTSSRGYKVARQFMARLKDESAYKVVDTSIDYQSGDLFVGLDLQPVVVPAQLGYLKAMHAEGVGIYFVVYDLLCLSMPEFFDAGLPPAFEQWLHAISHFNGALCISEATANDLSIWINEHASIYHRGIFRICSFHMGADIENAALRRTSPDCASEMVTRIKENVSFLMVGTLEPRKGHQQILDAFEVLWSKNVNVLLIIVGKQGWKVDSLVQRIRKHPEFGKRLIWIEGISDEYLDSIYIAAACLIAASFGEGFGLPLIEAAQHKLPIIARDIPVFREVAGEHAFYFKGESPTDLAGAIRDWLSLYQQDAHPKSDEMPWLSWKQSASNLMQIITQANEK